MSSPACPFCYQLRGNRLTCCNCGTAVPLLDLSRSFGWPPDSVYAGWHGRFGERFRLAGKVRKDDRKGFFNASTRIPDVNAGDLLCAAMAWDPEHRLLLAILNDAFSQAAGMGANGREHRAGTAEERQSLKEWVRETGVANRWGSLEYICEALVIWGFCNKIRSKLIDLMAGEGEVGRGRRSLASSSLGKLAA